MAVNPVIIKLLASKTLSTITDEEKRTRLIVGIAITIILIVLIILIPIYLLTNPIEILEGIITDEVEIDSILNFKEEYKVKLEKGKLTFKGKFPFPLEKAENYIITSDYGDRIHPITGKYNKHTGIDIVTIHHDNVLAIADGIITIVDNDVAFGNCIEIKHNIDGEEFYSFYAHLSKINVTINHEIKQGDIIGIEGGEPNIDSNIGYSTGHHLHFEIRLKSGYGNDIEPNKYLL